MATIKNIILLAFTTLMMPGCEDTTISHTTSDGNIVVIIDSCEYIRQHTYMYDIHTHKGNCRFCKERDSIKWEKRKKELEDLVIKLKEK